MLKITGFDKFQKQLKEAQRALGALDGELGTVKFDPHDPLSIEAAIQSVYKMVDDRAGEYESNPIVGQLVAQMRETYRDNIIQKAAQARLKKSEDE